MKFFLLTFIATILLTVTVGFIGIQVFDNGDNVNETPAVLTTVVELAENQQFDEAIAESYKLINSGELTEEDMMIVMNELVFIVLTSEELKEEVDILVETLYVQLYSWMIDEQYSDLLRSQAVVVIDRLFWETNFKVDYFVASFDKAADFTFDDQYQDAEKYELAYRVLFDLNEYADTLFTDKYLVGMQGWIVGTSILSVEPPAELFDEFENYLVTQFSLYDESSYTIPSQDFQRESLDTTLIAVKMNLKNVYPDRFDFVITTLEN